MRSEAVKGTAEIEVFKQFVQRSGLPIDLLSIEKRRPPEPDLICVNETEGPLAFELVTLCDPQIAKVISTGQTTDTFWTSDPSARAVTNKLCKCFKTKLPVELLAYTDGRIVTPDDVIIPTVSPLFSSIRGPYRRVWFMGEKTTCLLWSDTPTKCAKSRPKKQKSR